ncbi:MAG: hypothetical protein U0174_08495 [Polyangiaceae bacterium]
MRYISHLAALFVVGVLAVGGYGCAGGDEPEPTASDDVTRAQLLSKMRNLVLGYKDAEWDLKKAKYVEAENLVYEAYGLSALVTPGVHKSFINVREGTAPVLETNLAGNPRLTITTRHFTLAVSNEAYLGNFVSLLTHEYIHVWQHFHGYAGNAKHDQREFLANAFNVLGGQSLMADKLRREAGFDVSSIPPVVEPQRMINAAQVVKNYGTRRGAWGLNASDTKAYDTEYDACKVVYDRLSKVYNDNGTKK